MRRLAALVLFLALALPASAQTNEYRTGSIAANGDTVRIGANRTAGGTIQLTGTWAGTILVECTAVATTYATVALYPVAGGSAVQNATANGVWMFAGNYQDCRARASAWTSGTAGVALITSSARAPSLGSGSGASGVSSIIAGTGISVDQATGAVTVTNTGASSTAFDAVTSGTNSTAAMVVTTGASLGASGSGTIAATSAPLSGVSGLGSNVATFLATPTTANLAAAVTGETGTGALVFATSPTLVTPALGTPSSGVLTSATGLPISTGVSGLGANVATFLGTPSSANLLAALTDETGTGSAVFATSPTLVTPTLGVATATSLQGILGNVTPAAATVTALTASSTVTLSGISGSTQCLHANSSGVVTGTGSDCGSGGSTAFSALTGSTNTTAAMVVGTGASLAASGSGTLTATAVPVGGVSGLGSGVGTFLATPSSANLITAVTDETGSGALVFATSPTLVTPALGTPASGVATNLTGTAAGLTAGNVTTNANLTGDVTSVGNAATLANIPTAVPAAGSIVHTNIAAPSSPAAGKVSTYSDSTDLRFHDKNASGVIGTTVVADAGASNNFLTAISAAGAVSKAQPAFTNISGTATVAQGGTGLTAGTSGGVLAYTASGTLASSGALTANLPVIGGGAGVAPTVGTRSGNTTAYVTTTGTQTSGDCVKIDASGNHIANGSACGGGSGTINSGVTNIVPKYTASTTIDDSLLSDDGTTLTYTGTGGIAVTGTAGSLLATAITAPSTPAAGKGAVYVDSTSKNLAVKDDAGVVKHGIQSVTGAIDDAGAVTSSGTGGFARVTSPTFVTPLLGTPTSGVATNLTGLPISTGVSGLGTGVATFLATPSSANLISAVTDETGSGALVFATSPTLVTPALGTPASGVITNLTGVATNITYDVENTGNVFSMPVKRWLPAAGCNNATAGSVWDLPTTTPAVPTCVTGTNIQKGVLAFADTSGGFSAQITEELPSDWTTTGGLDIVLLWTTTATTGNAKWSVSTACTDVAATATDDPSFNTANTATTAVPGTASRVQSSALTNLTVTGCTNATRMLLHIKVFRDGNDGSDTCSCTTNLIGASLTFRRSM